MHHSEPKASVNTRVDAEAMSVTVSAQKTYDPKMGAFFWKEAPQIAATATAQLNGTMPLCLLTLDPKHRPPFLSSSRRR